MELTWTRRYSFQSVHQLDSGVLRERMHGHSYSLEVTCGGGAVDEIDHLVEEFILRELHGRELSKLTPSTGEHIVNWIHQRLNTTALAPRLKAVALQETRKNRFISALSQAKYV